MEFIELHPANDKHDGAKAKNTRKTNAPTAVQKPVPKKVEEKR